MIDFPPFTIYGYSEEHEEDDCSELTEPCEGDETSQMAEEGGFSRIMAMMDNSQFAPPRPSSNSDRILVNNIPVDTSEKREKHKPTDLQVEVGLKRKTFEEKQELLHLRLQIAKQNKMLNLLSSELNKFQSENQTLKAKAARLTDELAHARNEVRSSSLRRRASESKAGDSMKMLLNTNARLKADNERLQESLDGVRKSQQCHMKFNRGMKLADEDIRILQQEKEKQERQIVYSERKDFALTEDTAKTLLTSDSATGGNLNQDQETAHAVVDGSRPRLPSTKQHIKKIGSFLYNPASRRMSFPSPATKYVQKEMKSKDDRGDSRDKVTNTVGEKVTADNNPGSFLYNPARRRKSLPSPATKYTQKEMKSNGNHGGTRDKVRNTVGEKVTAYDESEGLPIDIVERRRYYPAAA